MATTMEDYPNARSASCKWLRKLLLLLNMARL
jgi:hypothetical protein